MLAEDIQTVCEEMVDEDYADCNVRALERWRGRRDQRKLDGRGLPPMIRLCLANLTLRFLEWRRRTYLTPDQFVDAVKREWSR